MYATNGFEVNSDTARACLSAEIERCTAVRQTCTATLKAATMMARLAPEKAPCRVTLTFFHDRAARRAELWTGTLDDTEARWVSTCARTKGALPLASGGRFGGAPSARGSLRHDANLVGVQSIIGEHDAGWFGPDAAKARFHKAGVAALAYATPSSRDDAPRLRFILPLSAEHPPAAYKGLVDKLAAVLGEGVLAPESWVRSQAFYFGRVTGGPCNVFVVNGVPLDLVRTAGRDPRHEGAEASVPDDDADADWTATVAQRPETPPPTMAQLREALSFIPPDLPRAEWVRIAAGLRGHEAETAEPTEGLFVDWSAGRLRRDGARAPANFVSDDDCTRLFRSLHRDRIEA